MSGPLSSKRGNRGVSLVLKASGRVRKQVWVIACISLTLVTVGVVLGMPLRLHPLSVAITIVATLVWVKVLVFPKDTAVAV